MCWGTNQDPYSCAQVPPIYGRQPHYRGPNSFIVPNGGGPNHYLSFQSTPYPLNPLTTRGNYPLLPYPLSLSNFISPFLLNHLSSFNLNNTFLGPTPSWGGVSSPLNASRYALPRKKTTSLFPIPSTTKGNIQLTSLEKQKKEHRGHVVLKVNGKKISLDASSDQCKKLLQLLSELGACSTETLLYSPPTPSKRKPLEVEVTSNISLPKEVKEETPVLFIQLGKEKTEESSSLEPSTSSPSSSLHQCREIKERAMPYATSPSFVSSSEQSCKSKKEDGSLLLKKKRRKRKKKNAPTNTPSLEEKGKKTPQMAVSTVSFWSDDLNKEKKTTSGEERPWILVKRKKANVLEKENPTKPKLKTKNKPIKEKTHQQKGEVVSEHERKEDLLSFSADSFSTPVTLISQPKVSLSLPEKEEPTLEVTSSLKSEHESSPCTLSSFPANKSSLKKKPPKKHTKACKKNAPKSKQSSKQGYRMKTKKPSKATQKPIKKGIKFKQNRKGLKKNTSCSAGLSETKPLVTKEVQTNDISINDLKALVKEEVDEDQINFLIEQAHWNMEYMKNITLQVLEQGGRKALFIQAAITMLYIVENPTFLKTTSGSNECYQKIRLPLNQVIKKNIHLSEKRFLTDDKLLELLSENKDIYVRVPGYFSLFILAANGMLNTLEHEYELRCKQFSQKAAYAWLNTRSDRGESIGYVAAKNNQLAVLKWLYKKGIDLLAPNFQGQSSRELVDDNEVRIFYPEASSSGLDVLLRSPQYFVTTSKETKEFIYKRYEAINRSDKALTQEHKKAIYILYTTGTPDQLVSYLKQKNITPKQLNQSRFEITMGQRILIMPFLFLVFLRKVKKKPLSLWFEKLWAFGASKHVRDDQGNNLLLIAVQYGDMDVIDFLWAHYDSKERNKSGVSLYHLALARGEKIFRAILDLGKEDEVCMENQLDKSGQNILSFAACFGYFYGIKIMIEERGFNPNGVQNKAMPPVFLALLQGEFRIVDYLLSRPHIEVAFTDVQGNAYHLGEYCIVKNPQKRDPQRLKVAQRLISSFAWDPQSLTRRGISFFQQAKEYEDQDMMDLFQGKSLSRIFFSLKKAHQEQNNDKQEKTTDEEKN